MFYLIKYDKHLYKSYTKWYKIALSNRKRKKLVKVKILSIITYIIFNYNFYTNKLSVLIFFSIYIVI